jgi:hypothetical protein
MMAMRHEKSAWVTKRFLFFEDLPLISGLWLSWLF